MDYLKWNCQGHSYRFGCIFDTFYALPQILHQCSWPSAACSAPATASKTRLQWIQLVSQLNLGISDSFHKFQMQMKDHVTEYEILLIQKVQKKVSDWGKLGQWATGDGSSQPVNSLFILLQ